MSSNNNENKILPLCPECGRLPFFQFEGYPISCITIKCECGLNDSFDIKEYLKRNKNNQEKVIKNCQIHLLPFSEFCLSCQKSICQKCIDHNRHSKTEIINEPSFYKSTLELKTNLQKVYDEASHYMIKLKNKYITRLIEIINTIESKYEEWSFTNKNIHELLNIIINSYSQEEPSFYIINNIKSIQKVSLQRYKFDNSDIINEYNYTNLINYFNYSILFDQIQKTFIPNDFDFVEEKKITKIHKSSIRSLILLTDGRIASSSSDNTIKIYNKKTYECELTLTGHKDTVWSICSLDNNRIVSSSSDKQIKFWKVTDKTFSCEYTIKNAHEDEILFVVSLSKNRIASCGLDGKINIWSLYSYKLIAQLPVNREKKSIVKGLIQLNKKEILVSGAYDDDLCIWNLNTYNSIKRIPNIVCSWSNALLQIDGNRIIVGGKSKIVVINIISYTIEQNIQGSFQGDIFSFLKLRNGNILFGVGNHSLYVYSFHTQNSYEIPNSHTYNINCLLSINNRNFSSCSGDQSIIVWSY